MTPEMTYCGESYHDQLGYVVDCGKDDGPCRGCLRAHIVRLEAALKEAEGARVVPGPPANANHPVCRCCGGAAYELPSGVYLQRVNDFGVPGIWQCSESCQPLTASRVLKDGVVAVSAAELIALQELFAACGNAIHARSGGQPVTLTEINDAWAGVCAAQVMQRDALRAQPTEGGAP